MQMYGHCWVASRLHLYYTNVQKSRQAAGSPGPPVAPSGPPRPVSLKRRTHSRLTQACSDWRVPVSQGSPKHNLICHGMVFDLLLYKRRRPSNYTTNTLIQRHYPPFHPDITESLYRNHIFLISLQKSSAHISFVPRSSHNVALPLLRHHYPLRCRLGSCSAESRTIQWCVSIVATSTAECNKLTYAGKPILRTTTRVMATPIPWRLASGISTEG